VTDAPRRPRRASPDRPEPGDTPGTVVRRGPDADRPRWALIGGIAAVALVVGWLWPRACGLRFGGEEETPTAASAVPSGEAPSAEPPAADAGRPAPTSNEPPPIAVVTVGKSVLMHCQDPPAGDLKPSKCGEPALDSLVAPKLEQLSSCPTAAGLTGRLQVGVDLNFKTLALKVTAGKSSAIYRQGKRDDKAIEPLLACLRNSLKDVVAAGDTAAAREHARYVHFFPLTITSPAGVAPAPSATASEKSMSGVAKVEVDTAIVRDAPNTNGQPIGRLSRGTRVTTVGASGNWYHIKFGDNDAQEGWIFRTNIGK
jgi:hypothetical protein